MRGEGRGGVGWGWCGWVGWAVGGLPDGGEHEAKGRRILESLIRENWRTCRRDGGRVFLPGEGKWCFILQYRGTQFSPQIREIWETVSIFPSNRNTDAWKHQHGEKISFLSPISPSSSQSKVENLKASYLGNLATMLSTCNWLLQRAKDL